MPNRPSRPEPHSEPPQTIAESDAALYRFADSIAWNEVHPQFAYTNETINPRTARQLMEQMTRQLEPQEQPSLGEQWEPTSFSEQEVSDMYRRASSLLTEWYQSQQEVERPQRGRRHSQYFERAIEAKHRSLPLEEVLDAEMPLPLQAIDTNTYQLLFVRDVSPSVRGIGTDGNGRRRIICSSCGRQVPNPELAFVVKGRVYCALHARAVEECALCHKFYPDTGEVCNFDGSIIRVCPGCTQQPHMCRSCGASVEPQFWQVRYCEDCIERDGPSDAMRGFSRALKWVGEETGKILKSNRMVSCEVEGVSPGSASLVRMVGMIPGACGVSGDGSIETAGRQQAFEIQTPRIAGARGEELIARMTTAFRETEAEVNKSCGMHIHLDGKGIVLPSRREKPLALLQLWKTYLIFEDVITSFIPYERRKNDYCRMMSGTFSVHEVETCTTLLEAEKLWYKERTYTHIQSAKGHHYHDSRYFGVNFHSLLANGHLEIRYHSGTLNARKILEWMNLHSLIMDACARKVMTFEFLEEAQATSSLREKTTLLFDKIGLGESSRQYFFRRQKKFADKKFEEDSAD